MVTAIYTDATVLVLHDRIVITEKDGKKKHIFRIGFTLVNERKQ